MNSKKKLRELFEYIRTLEERARCLYDNCLGRLRDPEVIQIIKKFRAEEAKHVGMADELLSLLRKYDAAVPLNAHTQGRYLSLITGYVLIGLLLGLGAPLGCLFFKVIPAHGTEISNWLLAELASQNWYYAYMTLGTVSVFILSSLMAGILHARLRKKAADLTVKTRVLEDLSARDSLTGLHNFGYIRERLQIEMERSKRFQTPLSCLMIDIDKLKEVNDSLGHPAGDYVIYQVAQCIQKDIRVIDTATRYGGDEFFIILPVTPGEGTWVVAERIRSKVGQLALAFNGHSLGTTVSVGIATFPGPEVTDVEQLVHAADRAVYEAKRSGRDRTVYAIPPASMELQAQNFISKMEPKRKAAS